MALVSLVLGLTHLVPLPGRVAARRHWIGYWRPDRLRHCYVPRRRDDWLALVP